MGYDFSLYPRPLDGYTSSKCAAPNSPLVDALKSAQAWKVLSPAGGEHDLVGPDEGVVADEGAVDHGLALQQLVEGGEDVLLVVVPPQRVVLAAVRRRRRRGQRHLGKARRLSSGGYKMRVAGWFRWISGREREIDSPYDSERPRKTRNIFHLG